ncbi:putative divalent heavy-metal cations transporter [Thermobacillus composti KWC4]|uniref:Putative divalent heavy-metal cations transporter n=1 Tax=Thermobacillus composti (strain DSM 18247 / JCM 13945 / KWC4) TaxID=717605 RepID=L0E9I1_THECK|nr:ZIP family metal transporter [Thermobacillus composti]AGA56331.1 putative divalent heavy-metal cations transporter [Thermobacillus composti KWC4]
MNTIIIGSLATSLCTTLGALPAMLFTNVTHRGRDILLAFTAGIMVSASTYGLIPSALKLSNLFVLAIGILLGTIILTLMELFVPHKDPEHSKMKSPHATSSFLFLSAMALHNLPEGLSVGVSFGSSVHELGAIVALSIGLQNIPEGFLTALFLITHRMNKWLSLLLATFTGMLELLFCWIGYVFTGSFTGIVPYGLAFAAGAMLFVVYKELIPESHGDGNERASTFSFIIGLLTMIGITHLLK